MLKSIMLALRQMRLFMGFGLVVGLLQFGGILTFVLCPCALSILLVVGMTPVNEAFIATAVSTVLLWIVAQMVPVQLPRRDLRFSLGYSAAIFLIGFVFHVLIVAF